MPNLVKDYMDKEVPTVEESQLSTEAAKIMMKTGKGFLIVLQNSKLSGILTERDFVNKIVAAERDPIKVKVGDIMSFPLITIDPDEDILRASEMMQKHDVRRLPVTRGGIIYGVITAKDIARQAGEYVEREVKEILKRSTQFRY
ncbi:MAG: CBS domain-containing protein [Nitrososphaeria archaeon]|jgi:CBS domain-containing protein